LVTGLADLAWRGNALHFLGCSSVQIYCIQLSCDFHKKLLCLENFSSLLKKQKFRPLCFSFSCYSFFFSLSCRSPKRIYCQKSSSCLYVFANVYVCVCVFAKLKA